ncbi:MAG: hypothetical protein E6G89_10980 [Alphaproteobacteria bacterium]|nr:MAG: hypothetical protein E6G89_10980 [Alphaproteobacteria bacterium]
MCVWMVRTFAARLGVWRLAIFLVSALWLACPARPAQISMSSHGGPPLITITGEFDFGDVIKFLRKTEGIQDAVVVLKGPGGNAVAGMQIGKAIRQKGFLTVVPPSTNCASACALAWLGGLPRFMAQDSRIGFHSAYFVKGGRPRKSTAANSLVAAYLKGLRMRRQAIAHITGAPPERLYWLTIDAARSLGIEAGIYTSHGITSTLGKAPLAAATPMKQPPSGMTIKKATDYPGNDVDRLQQTTLANCVLACSDSADCKAVTFITRRRECWIKSAIGSAEPRDGLISAIK